MGFSFDVSVSALTVFFRDFLVSFLPVCYHSFPFILAICLEEQEK